MCNDVTFNQASVVRSQLAVAATRQVRWADGRALGFQLIVFLKGFTQEEREKLAIALGICLANGLGNPTCLQALFEDHLVKDGKFVALATDTCLRLQVHALV